MGHLCGIVEEALAEVSLTDDDEEMAWEKVCYEVKRGLVVQQEVAVEEDEDEGEGKGEDEEDEDEDEPVHSSRLLVKHPAK